MTQALRMEHTVDPKQQILDEAKPFLGMIQVTGARLVVGIYVRTEAADKTKGGVIMPKGVNQAGDEDRYQGIVGLVIKMGPLAFQEDENHKWGGVVPKIGDWVTFTPGSTVAFYLGKRRCRHLEDVHVDMIVAEPDIVL